MKKLLILPLMLLSLLSFSQSNLDIIEIGDEKVSLEEFKRVYQKNNSGELVSKSSVEEYIQLYINFKLKVKEAVSLDMQKDEAFIKELAGYRAQLAQPYMSEESMLTILKKEAYERLKYEINASHILVKVEPSSSPADTLAAYKKILKYRKMALDGDFEKVAKQYSEDPSAKSNGGLLGYFTAFYMVYPFESGAYETKVGGISNPVRTRFGYHILKVNDKRKSNGTMTAAHILISTDAELASTDQPENRANEIFEKLKEGAKFEELASQFSDDQRSSSNGGLLPPFTVGKMIKEFELVAYNLQNDGDFSKPVKTKYGWHIIKRVSKEELGSYEDLEIELEGKVKKDSRSNLTEGAALKKIQTDYGFSENLKELDDFKKLVDESYHTEDWDPSVLKKLKKTMFKIGNKQVNQTDFTDYLVLNKGADSKANVESLIASYYKSFKKNEILNYKDSKLEDEYPEFKDLIQEYHDGILLFNLTDKLIWTKAVEDTLGLEAFYEKNKETYKWGKRVNANVFSALNNTIADQTIKALKENKDINEVIEEINRSSQLNLRKESKKYEKGENEIVDMIDWKEGFSRYIDNNGRVSFVQINKIIEPSYKTLDDSKGIITSDYQEHLELNWIKELRSKYPFTINDKAVEELKSQLKNQ